MLRVRHGAIVCALWLAGCPASPTPPPAKGDATKAKTPEGKADAKAPADTTKAADAGPMGKTLATAPIPWDKLIGADPPTAESFLGEPAAKGGHKDSCVRFVPDRTWFKCRNVWQRYQDTTGTAEFVHVTYEDKKVASVAFEKLKGEGPFDPVKALASVGLELPSVPELNNPQPNVKVWSWWNSAARLRIGGRQYRVEVSLVDDQWSTSKVDVILNDPLTDDEKSRVFEVKPQRGAG